MEPRIQYAKTADGVSIAFRTLGEGTPYVSVPVLPLTHIELEWQIPQMRRWQERLAEKRMLVRYDSRGCGLSDRDVSDYSLDGHLLDLEAVLDRLGLERFALSASFNSGPVAIAYAARHPEQVSHLVLWLTWARSADFWQSSRTQAFTGLRETDFDLYIETAANMMAGGADPELGKQFAAFMRESVTPETHQAIIIALRKFDVAHLLEDVRSPTLVLHPRQQKWIDVGLARGLASRIPNARLTVLEQQHPLPDMGDIDAVLAVIDDFLGEGEEATEAPSLAAEDIHTILFTDVEGSTALTQRLGDAKAREVLREHERMVREALKAHGGAEVKALGDGFMTSFSSATKALECAIAMQRAFAAHNRGVGAALAPPQGAASDAPTAPTATEPLHIRIGLNAGEPIAEEDPDGRSDLYGTAVNRAARIAAKAQGGEILVANVVRELAEGKEFLFADRGETSLKGFDEPVRLFEVRWQAEPTEGQA